MPHLIVGAEICEDVWVPNPPSTEHALAGATVIVNLSASDEMTGKDSYRRNLINSTAARLICGYISTAGEGESSTDFVYGGQNLISENGSILAEAKRFANQTIYADMDVDKIVSERRRMTTYPEQDPGDYVTVPFHLRVEDTKLERFFAPQPFCPFRHDEAKRALR